MPVSAATGDGVERLERVMLEQMPEGEPGFPDDYLTDQPERTIVAETVREKVLQNTRAELPFSTAVVVDQFDEAERERMLRLYCTIYVETESQKPIVIGRAGDMIKRIGTEARHDLGALLRHEGVPRPAGEGERGVARQRPRARRHRRAEIRGQGTAVPPAPGLEQAARRPAEPISIRKAPSTSGNFSAPAN